MRTALAGTVVLLLTIGCHTIAEKSVVVPEPTYSYYHLDGFSWERVGRVLVPPMQNRTDFTRAAEEVRLDLCAELRQAGRFEVIAPPPDHPDCLAALAHDHGRFDEAAMLELASVFRADVVLLGTVTHYSPYKRPQLGLALQAIAPAEGKVAASVHGLWDSNRADVAAKVQAFYALPKRRFHFGPPTDEGYVDELALESPRLFRRFVCHEAVGNLLGVAGVVGFVCE